ncbi:BatD family protein [Dyella tabacisoli]|uniref:Protein BatD n=1 Tax=Dyella tabacisoli TaxID=2282381 RepID=A0A369UN93_9GAMM|nr:BatD family protein [Dyella tabacisoli]RDD81947.1 protein BatD [Dyella tabacisoli]
MWRRVFTVVLMLLLLSPLAATAVEVQATLDRSRVSLGETVTLNLRLQGGGSANRPDLSALAQDFIVLGSSSSSSLRIVNGSSTAELTYGVALRPKRVGMLQIPSLNFAGGITQPLQLEVVAVGARGADSKGPDSKGSDSKGPEDAFMEASVDPASGYVGQQLQYIVRMYFAVNLNGGSLIEPKLDGVGLSRVGDEVDYQTERNGRRYSVVEQHYALIPQKPGHLEIPPMLFQGEAMDMSNPDAFFGNPKPISVASSPVSIEVRSIPAAASGITWLPAHQLHLALEGLPAGGELRVGEPLNLSMNLEATGLPYEALPPLSLPTLDGATVYPGKKLTGTRQEAPWLVGRYQQSFAVVPNRPGTLTIPEITLTWWNVQTDRAEVARLPARSFTVLPAAGAAVQAPPGADHTATVPTTPMTAPNTWPWRGIAFGSLALWLLSLLGWLGWRRRRALAEVVAVDVAQTPRRLRATFLAAARGDDSAAQARSLLAWARAERPALQNLGELAAALGSEPQQAAIAALQRKHYAGSTESGVGERLATAFRDGFVWRDVGAAATSLLPPLYPFSTTKP